MKRYLRDIVERAAKTYVQVLIGLVLAENVFADGTVDLSVLQTAAVAAIPAALSVVSSALSQFRGDPDSASLSTKV